MELELLVQSARRHVHCFHEDVDAWKVGHDETEAWHMLGEAQAENVDEGTRLFNKIVSLDLKHRTMVADRQMEWNQNVDDQLREVLADWLRAASGLLALLTVC